MTTWNDVRRNVGDQLRRDDYNALAAVKAGHVRKTEGGRSMVQFRIAGGKWEYRPMSMRKLLALELVTDPAPCNDYETTAAGDAALDEWLANRPTYPTPATEGTQ